MCPPALSCSGADRLKEALQALGLKCGGTPRQRAERLFSLKGRDLQELPPSLFVRGARPAGLMSDGERRKAAAAAYHVAFTEAKIEKVVEMLGTVLEDTQGRVEKKQAQTVKEREVCSVALLARRAVFAGLLRRFNRLCARGINARPMFVLPPHMVHLLEPGNRNREKSYIQLVCSNSRGQTSQFHIGPLN